MSARLHHVLVSLSAILLLVSGLTIVVASVNGCSTTKETVSTKPAVSSESTNEVAPPTSLPRLRFSPPVLVTTPDSLGFVTAKVYIHNDGGGSLVMSEVKGSCGCAGASVQRNKVVAPDSGMIYLQINTKSFTEPINNVDFTVKSNADNSPTVFRAIIHKTKQ